jgi:murein DD-endopeptidase MepM/ murein hydrolase activator NlpD
MKVVLISDNGIHHKKVTVNIWLHVFLPIVVLVAGIAIVKNIDSIFASSALFPSKKDNKAYENFNLVLNKLSVLDAEVQRLNILNTHIASRSKLDIAKYGLENQPARGGGVASKHFKSRVVRQKDLNSSVIDIERALAKEKLKLKNLLASLEIKEAEDYLTSLSKISLPKSVVYDFSIPVKKGYISSPYGTRRDPINGSLRHHSGLDIAAVKGSPVFAIANGFIDFTGKKGAYGNLIEINHSENLKSRYAHLDKILIKKGQPVRKGDLIGRVGSTGRVTGPHLHLEIKENNKITNPKNYLKDALKNL